MVLPTFFGPPHMCAVCVDFKDRGQGGLFGATRSAYGQKRLFWTLLGALWCPWMALPDLQNCSNASPGMCPDLIHPYSTLFHQFGATRSAYGPKRLFLAVLDPFGSPLAHPHGPPWPPKRFQCNTRDVPWLVPPLFHTVPPVWNHQIRFWPKKAVFGCFGPCLAALWHTHMALPDQRNGNGKKLPQKIFFSRNFSYSRQMRCFACMCKISWHLPLWYVFCQVLTPT